MTQKVIDLKKYRGNASTIFTGRPQGEEARRDLKLDDLDKSSDLEIQFVIPEGTTSFNPSFYLGMLYHSYKNLGINGFSEKYKFLIRETTPEIRKVIEENIEDGVRNAINEFEKKTGLWPFIEKKD